MVTRNALKSIAILWGFCIFVLTISAPAAAHKEHKKKPAQAEQVVPAPQAAPEKAESPMADHATMGETIEPEGKDRSNMSTPERLLDWLGRLHPIIVHFPIAFFPAALFTAIIGRRRPALAVPVQFLVVAGGVIAPVAALLGWFDGGLDFTTDDWLLQFHRWLGTGIGVAALGLAVWAWRRPDANRSIGMVIGLALLTVAIVIQGWFGGAMVHGVDHLNW